MEVVLGSNKSLHLKYSSYNVNCCGHPWLVVCDKKKEGRILFYNFIEGRYYFVSIPNSSNSSLWFCFNGWLFFENYDLSRPNFLFNLMSMETVQLPPLLDYRPCRISCIVTAPPTDPNCRVIIIESFKNLFLWQPGQYQFVKETIIFGDSQPYNIGTATSFKGMIYAFIEPGSGLAKANYANPNNFEILWTGSFIHTQRVAQGFKYLVGLDGDLLLIHQLMMGDGHDGVLNFIIYKANFEDKKWVKVENSLNDNAIFLNQHQGFASTVKGPEIKTNSIYFSLPMDRDFYVFNLENRSVTVLPTSTKISRRHSQLYWLMLPCQNSF